IIKLTKSGKGFLVVDDFGNAFITSKSFVESLSGNRIVLLKRFPNKIQSSRFKPSPLYDPEGLASKRDVDSGSQDLDGLGREFRKDISNRKVYEDEVVW
ncbi:MAG: hypothetical protein DRN81_04680, partial [Thermoproteota archaeon]